MHPPDFLPLVQLPPRARDDFTQDQEIRSYFVLNKCILLTSYLLFNSRREHMKASQKIRRSGVAAPPGGSKSGCLRSRSGQGSRITGLTCRGRLKPGTRNELTY